MISNPFFLISILISPLIAFATMAVIVESAIILFKIKPGRMTSILRLLPYISIFFDTLFSQLSVGYWLNPLNCSSCVQKLLLTLFFPDLKNYLYTNEISLVSHLGSEVSHFVFSFIFITFSSLIIYLTLCKLIEVYIVSKSVKDMISSENICARTIENSLLSATIKMQKTKIFVSDKIEIPMATYSKAIFIPKNIVEQYPQKEFEAIVMHELEHVRWKDPIVRMLIQLLSTVFWWVPTGTWQNKLEFDQEIACDRSIVNYGFEEEFLASALIKVAKYAKKETPFAPCYLTEERHPILKRLRILLGLTLTYSKRYERACFSICAIGLMILLGCLAMY